LNVLFRCDASETIGLGHLVRCLALAKQLSSYPQTKCSFAMRNRNVTLGRVSASFPILFLDPYVTSLDHEEAFSKIVNLAQPDLIVLDVRDNLSASYVQSIKTNSRLIATIDDPEDKRTACDFAFYPPVPQAKIMDWKGFGGKVFLGLDYVILRDEFYRHRMSAANSPPKVLISMGGTDPKGLTSMVVKCLVCLDDVFEMSVVLGSSNLQTSSVKDILAKSNKEHKIHFDVENMADLMAEADLAITAFGMTAYELATMAVPALYVCLTEDHDLSASLLNKLGVGKNLGLYSNVDDNRLSFNVRSLINDEFRRKQMSNNAKAHFLTNGAKKIAEILFTAARQKSPSS
jgi:UDP-2,4-diacetamido-2,4,6-trideoxy-beta-L-altropyranose hydrolase